MEWRIGAQVYLGEWECNRGLSLSGEVSGKACMRRWSRRGARRGARPLRYREVEE